jgi:hypothetical protein
MLTDDQILEIAKQVTWRYPSPQNESLIAFARLIEKQVREEDARICADIGRKYEAPHEAAYRVAAEGCAAAIRKGGMK